MKHERWQNLLLEERDRPLTADERRELDAHLAQCPACRDFDRAWKQALALMVPLEKSPPNETFVQATMARVRTESPWPWYRRIFIGPTGFFTWRPVLGGALALLIVGVFFWRPKQPPAPVLNEEQRMTHLIEWAEPEAVLSQPEYALGTPIEDYFLEDSALG